MLRITVCDDSENTRIVVEGKLAGATVSELEKSWHKTIADPLRVRVVVDLSCVTFVDTSGKELLKRMHESGIRFIGTGIMPKCLIEEIESTANAGAAACSKNTES